jgi:hypothetical protein
MSQVEVDKIIPQSGTTLTIGDSGDTIAIASGATLSGSISGITNLTISGDLTVDTNTLYVDSTNNRVGIGTSSPGTILHVISDTNADGMILNCVGTPTNFHFDVRNDNATIFRVDENGNIGIGLANPGEKLDVAGNMSGNNVLPRADNLYDLGSSSKRYNDLYLGGGLYVGGTAAANLLDDYEEGTWTPTLIGSTTNPSPVYFRNTGNYTKIGNTVRVSGYIQLTTGSTGGSGDLRISGLPFSTQLLDSNMRSYVGTIALYSVPYPTDVLSPILFNDPAINNDFTILGLKDNAAWVAFDAANAAPTDLYAFQITYQTA